MFENVGKELGGPKLLERQNEKYVLCVCGEIKSSMWQIILPTALPSVYLQFSNINAS